MTSLRLSALYAAQGIATGLLLPFLVPLLAGRGFTVQGIGLALGLSAAVTVVAYPAWGYLADLRIGRVWVLRIASAVAALAGVALGATGDNALATAAVVSLVSIGCAPWGPIADAIALGGDGAEARDYGTIRRWTSLGWVAAAPAGGVIYALAGPGWLPLLFGVSALGIAASTVGARLPPGPRTAMKQHEPGDGDGGSGIRWFLGLARRSPVVGPFLLGLFVISVGGGAAMSFLPLRILETGGGPLLIGIASALPAALEIPVFSVAGSLAVRIGLRGLFLAGISVAVAQLLVVAVAPDPLVITIVRTVDGAAWALRYTATVLVVAAALPGRVRAMGQSATSLVVGGIAPIAADPLGGLIYGQLGGTVLYAAGAVMVALGGAIASMALRGPEFRPARAASTA